MMKLFFDDEPRKIQSMLHLADNFGHGETIFLMNKAFEEVINNKIATTPGDWYQETYRLNIDDKEYQPHGINTPLGYLVLFTTETPSKAWLLWFKKIVDIDGLLQTVQFEPHNLFYTVQYTTSRYGIGLIDIKKGLNIYVECTTNIEVDYSIKIFYRRFFFDSFIPRKYELKY